MVIQIDSREKARIIQPILKEFDRQGIKYVISKLYVGDYQRIDNGSVVVDRKHNLAEIAANFGKDEKRLRREMQDAKDAGIQIVFLVEHGQGIKDVDDVINWENPRLAESPMALSGERIFRKMKAFEGYYGVRWDFCERKDTGKKIIKILGGEDDGKT